MMYLSREDEESEDKESEAYEEQGVEEDVEFADWGGRVLLGEQTTISSTEDDRGKKYKMIRK